ncbi:hypothetical protein AOL_s00007g289 [Orbilia oligospora ATCC 24927]|uniref:Uncharacterized protein n=1 Tax=Arthrobotrys oligospora (strain ATCC 24927 / CBS 115.81 / DSM 1491) TaxID=756982 RepID=G1X1Y0_ARTOA|nr:hypothetical protein AOL_s00007g289 [Orbilia oligospora ATCC 24927]EGX52953.1 hypothetical protein AOL_s00007g289 [Orbilia oligospora ATCC 24927]
MASYTLPIGVRPNTIHKEFYDNLVEGPHALDVDDKYLCVCGDPEVHIHCLRCLANIIKRFTALKKDIPEIAYPESQPEPVHYETSLLPTIRNVVVEAVPKNLAQPPCICSEMIESSFVAQDPRAHLVSYLEKPNSAPETAHTEQLQSYNTNPTQTFSPVCLHTSLFTTTASDIRLVQCQPNHTHYWMYKNYSIALDKGYNGSIEMEDAIPRTPSARFHERFGEESICHAMCNGSGDLVQYSYCRMIESGFFIFLLDAGVLDAPCCDKCDAGILSLLTVLSSDIADRMRDRVVGEIYNVNNVLGRQNKLALETWKGFNIHGTYGFCCKRTEDMSRCVRNMGVWLYTNPVYYAHKWGQDDGLMEFVEALNGFMMNELRRSQVGGENDVAKLDDIMKRMIGTRLEDFLVYFCA